MLITEMYNGQGLGNQLFCYIVTRVIATDKGFDFGIQSPEKFKGRDFLSLDFGQKVMGGNGPEGGPPRTLPKGIKYYYNERKISHPNNGSDIRTFDPDLVTVPDHTKIDGIMQDEQYIMHRRDEIREWLKVKQRYECVDYASHDLCVINFRGGEYVGVKDLFLPQQYWDDAVVEMRRRNRNMQFVVITDDEKTAKQFFPRFPVYHFNIAKDYAIIKNAHYLILSNSSFAWFPAWLNQNLRFCIAPKYWARNNISDGFWSCSYNITSGWHYLDRKGKLFDYHTCLKELEQHIKQHPNLFEQKKLTENFLVVSNYYNDLSWVPRYANHYVVYDQSNDLIYPPHLDQKKVVKSDHLGHNIRDYCNFIIDHYDQLPDRILLCAGNVFPRHVSREYFDQILNNQFFTPIEDFTRHTEDWPSSFISSEGGFCELNNSWYLKLNGFHPTRYFHDYNDFLRFCFVHPVIPRYIRFAPGANYIVTKQQILKYPKVFYKNLRTFVSHSKTAIPGEAHIIERALHTLWSCNFAINPQMLKPIDRHFVAIPPRVPSFAQKLESYSSYRLRSVVRLSRRVAAFIRYKRGVRT